MKSYQTISFEVKEKVGTLWLNRPEVRNAINGEMIDEIIDCLNDAREVDVRVVLLRGRGKTFCAGADIQWMKKAVIANYEENFQSNLKLAQCFHAIYAFPKPIIAVVHGAAMGGGNGLLSACDIAYAVDDTVFSFSEVKIGIIPATISPYVIKRIGEFRARELMLTARRLTGQTAAEYALINQSFATAKAMEENVEKLIIQLKENSPHALRQCKALITHVSNATEDLEQLIPYTAHMIAEARTSEEGQEGMAAFLDKRKPKWVE